MRFLHVPMRFFEDRGFLAKPFEPFAKPPTPPSGDLKTPPHATFGQAFGQLSASPRPTFSTPPHADPFRSTPTPTHHHS